MTDAKPGTLAEALAVLMTRLPRIEKNKTNPHFKSKYADLADVSRDLLPVLGSLGLSFTARPMLITRDDGTREFVLAYRLLHTSGEKDEGEYPLGTGTAQTLGGAITYARRFALCAVTGAVAEDDDDGQAASAPPAPQRQPRATRGNPPVRPLAELPRNADGTLSRSQITDAELAAYGAMTAAQLRDHNKLEREVKGTDSDGKSEPSVERLNGTPPDDPFLDPPAIRAPRPAGNPRAVIMQHFTRLGFKEPDHRDDRLEAISLIVGRHVESVNALNAGEGAKLIGQLAKMRDRDALEELLTELAAATADA